MLEVLSDEAHMRGFSSLKAIYLAHEKFDIRRLHWSFIGTIVTPEKIFNFSFKEPMPMTICLSALFYKCNFEEIVQQ